MDWRKLFTTIKDEWDEFPTIKAAVIVAAGCAGLLTLNEKLPSNLAIPVNETTKLIILPIIIVSWAILVAIFSSDRLRFEKKLRLLEQNYRYDRRGTLYNGSQPNIAFRIETFKNILACIQNGIQEDISNILANAGKKAGKDFANNLERIYNEDVARKRAKKPWSQLTLAEKLEQWADYDSATGWGILSVKLTDKTVDVFVTHYKELLSGEGGALFAHFLGGYCEAVIGFLVNSHSHGRYQEYDSAFIDQHNRKGAYTVEFKYYLG